MTWDEIQTERALDSLNGAHWRLHQAILTSESPDPQEVLGAAGQLVDELAGAMKLIDDGRRDWPTVLEHQPSDD